MLRWSHQPFDGQPKVWGAAGAHSEALLYCARRHDFVVVETIDFYADEDAELPPPMSQRDVILLNRAGGPAEDDEDGAGMPPQDAGAPGQQQRGKVGLQLSPAAAMGSEQSAAALPCARQGKHDACFPPRQMLDLAPMSLLPGC